MLYMKKEFKVFRCKKCGAMIMNIQECGKAGCEMMCCGEIIEKLIPNSVDASFEKHVPTYDVTEGVVRVKVNHVTEDEHYIEWLAYVIEDKQEMRYFEPNMVPETEFKYEAESKLYAYCNKHGLWEAVVE